MTRGAGKGTARRPERRCIVTGETQPKAGLIRFVAGPRGARSSRIWRKSCRGGLGSVADRAALTRRRPRGFSRIGGKGAGLGTAGFEMIETGPGAACHRHAVAGAQGGLAGGRFRRSGLAGRAGQRCSCRPATGPTAARQALDRRRALVRLPDRIRIGFVFGRDHVIHSALAPGAWTDKLIRDASRLTGLRGHDGGISAGKE